jgi:glycosyltransferase involved in cell wall biosynthesis
MVEVTVLVAVYNAAGYLPFCLDSLLGQSLADIQIICVDDGSTDGSLQILNDYAHRDKRVEVIHLDENCGQAHARNVGLQQARGNFVCMVDADDWLSPDALELMTDAFDDTTDCVLFDVVMVYDDREELYSMPAFESLTGQEAFRLSLTWQIHGLYGVRLAIHRDHPYDDTCRSYSDDNTTRIHYLSSRRVGRCAGRYYYRQHSASVTHQVSVRRFDYLRANESMRRQMLALQVDDSLVSLYENHRWLNLIDVCMFYHVHGRELSGADRRYGLQEIHRVWATIDRRALRKETTAKFGYRPCRLFRLFRLQEWLYFTLRGLLGRNR